MAYELEKAQYEQDEKWMKDPAYTAWEQIYVDAKGELRPPYVQCTCEPWWADSGWKYRRRPDAPTKACRLCKHVTTPNNCNRHDEQRPVGYWIDTNDYPSWCPLDAETVINPADVLPGFKFHNLGDDETKKEKTMGTKEDLKATAMLMDAEAPVILDGEMPLQRVDEAFRFSDAEAKQETCDKCSTCRHEYEPRKPVVVCLCGSCRFKDEFIAHYAKETDAGKIVLSVGRFMPQEEQDILPEHKKMLDELHKRKIDISDEILVLNVGGYVGTSTRSEIDYAIKSNKTIRYLEEPKPRTIRLDVDLPEPNGLNIEPDKIIIYLKNVQDTNAWYYAITKAMEAKWR